MHRFYKTSAKWEQYLRIKKKYHGNREGMGEIKEKTKIQAFEKF